MPQGKSGEEKNDKNWLLRGAKKSASRTLRATPLITMGRKWDAAHCPLRWTFREELNSSEGSPIPLPSNPQEVAKCYCCSVTVAVEARKSLGTSVQSYCNTIRGAQHCSGYYRTRRNPAYHRLDHSSIRASRSKHTLCTQHEAGLVSTQSWSRPRS